MALLVSNVSFTDGDVRIDDTLDQGYLAPDLFGWAFFLQGKPAGNYTPQFRSQNTAIMVDGTR